MNRSLRILMTGAFLWAAASASAHVVVSPQKANVAAWLTFTVSVPNEKGVPTTEVKLLVPEGIADVTPTLKPGWSVTVEKTDGHASAIVWKGLLPAGFRDDFTFSTQVPGQPGELVWKAYQTYADGLVVRWEADPASPDAHHPEAMEKLSLGPYSVTKIVDDLKTPAQQGLELPLSIVALVLSSVAAILSVAALRRRQ